MTYQRKSKPALWKSATASKPANKKRRPIRQVSKARAKRLREYHARVKVWKLGRECVGGPCPLKPHPCEDCHHRRGKLGPLLMDERHWVPVCRALHQWIDRNRALARELGLIQGPWNHKPK